MPSVMQEMWLANPSDDVERAIIGLAAVLPIETILPDDENLDRNTVRLLGKIGNRQAVGKLARIARLPGDTAMQNRNK